MIGLTLTTALLLAVAEARQNELFRCWEKAKADTRSLVVEFTLEKNNGVRTEKERFEGTVKLLRTAKGDLLASYTLTKAEKPGAAANPPFVGLLNGGNLYLLQPDLKSAIRFAPAGGDVRLWLEEKFNPFALLLDEKHARQNYQLKVVKQDEWYTYLDVKPKPRKSSGWCGDWSGGFTRGRAVFLNQKSQRVPKDMPRQLWYEDAAGNSYTFDIRRWKANGAHSPKADEFTRPEDRPGWEVNESLPFLFGEKRGEMRGGPPRKVGTIYIVGNDVTYDGAFLDRLGLHPGQPLTESDLRAAEWRLIPLWLLGIGCSVTTVDRDGDEEYADILVTAKESLITQVGGRGYNAAYSLLGIIARYRYRLLNPQQDRAIPRGSSPRQ
ncbi:MAG TPA: hypothetical protein VKA46_07070 [Gemmataceae bacterium]|nr:hypothetical protein [Gemmataceae bacterium]